MEPLPALLNISGIFVYPEDVIFSAFAIVGAVKLLNLGTNYLLRAPYSIWLMFGLLILFSFLRGFAQFGPEAAGVEFRKFFYLFAGGLYFSSFIPTAYRLNRLGKWWLGIALLLVILALIRWAIYLGLPLSIIPARETMRVLNAAETLFLAQVLFICVYLWLARDISVNLKRFAFLLLPVVILLQHRTVWIVLIVALVAVLLGYGVHGTIGVLIRAIRREQRSKPQVLELLRSIPQRSTLFLKPSLLAEICEQVAREA